MVAIRGLLDEVSWGRPLEGYQLRGEISRTRAGRVKKNAKRAAAKREKVNEFGPVAYAKKREPVAQRKGSGDGLRIGAGRTGKDGDQKEVLQKNGIYSAWGKVPVLGGWEKKNSRGVTANGEGRFAPKQKKKRRGTVHVSCAKGWEKKR